MDPDGILRAFAEDNANFDIEGGNYAYSLGVEKNPWVWVYVGVKAETRPRALFFPIGPRLKMVARAFAKPFGGRIGPWYQQTWLPGSSRSSGGPNEKVDYLLPPRNNPQGDIPNPSDKTRLPNYSRYPGDTLGMNSYLSQAAFRASNGGPLGGVQDLNSYAYYSELAMMFRRGQPNDILAWDVNANRAPSIREYELLAIAPDLFDITYYSIEPNFNVNYWPRLKNARGPLEIPDVPIRGDLGTRGEEPGLSVSVQLQMADPKATDSVGASLVDHRRLEAFYYVRDKAHLLTAWLPDKDIFVDSQMSSPGIPVKDFGHCRKPDDDLNPKAPGSCVAGGGRVGYSVKLVARDALLNGTFRIGGGARGQVRGPVENRPPVDEGW